MRVLTAADSNFYHCLEGLAQSVRRHYGKPLIVYDLGLTEEEKRGLDAEIVKIELAVDYKGYTSHNKTNFINTTHKPFCIRHYFESHDEPLIYADADCLFLERVELQGFDLGVTVKPKKKRDLTNYFNGILNAGILFFNKYPEKLVERWIRECVAGGHTDQSALAKILSETIDWQETDHIYEWNGISVKTLPVEIYNDYYLKAGKIMHFKGERHKEGIYGSALAAIRENRPFRMKKQTALERLAKSFKKRLSPERTAMLRLDIHSRIVGGINALFGTNFRLAWKKHEYFSSEWESRVKTMSELIESQDATIIDLGCGEQYLKKFLPGQMRYVPVDYVSRGEGTIVCDFNKGQFPDLQADVCFCSGVLEYIEDLEWFVGMLAGTAPSVIVSYNCKSDRRKKRPLIWVNALTEQELVKLFEGHGFTCVARAFHDKNDIFRFTKKDRMPQALGA